MTTEFNPNADVATAPVKKNGKRKRALLLVAAIVIIGIAAWAIWYFSVGRWHVDTDDAYVQGNVVTVTPQIGGTVVGINVEDGMRVEAGQTLVSFDASDADVAYAQAVANLAGAVRQVRGIYRAVDAGQADIAARQVALAQARADSIKRKVLSCGSLNGVASATTQDSGLSGGVGMGVRGRAQGPPLSQTPSSAALPSKRELRCSLPAQRGRKRPMRSHVPDPHPAVPHDPLALRLTGADDRLRLNEWLPPRAGAIPRIRIGTRWINVLWVLPLGFAVLVFAIAVAQGLRGLPAVQAFLVRYPGVPTWFSETPGHVQGPTPLLGQHTDEVLAELGLTEKAG